MVETAAQIKSEKTEYGRKKRGRSSFVVIAPHAAGDDVQTGHIARRLAKKLAGFWVVNYKYFKPTNSKAKQKPDFVEDFNKLYWSSKRNKYLWKRKKPAMKAFYQDVAEFCEEAKAKSESGQAIALYIHGMNHGGVGIDLGVGLRAKKNQKRFFGSSRSDYYCSGVPTIQIRQLKAMRALLQEALEKDYNLKVGVGFEYPAWSKRIAVQFHKHGGRSDNAIQIEINGRLRQTRNDLIYFCRLLSKILKQVFT